MKKISLLIILSSVILTNKIDPYESGWEFEPAKKSVECFDIIEDAITVSESQLLETHCKTTALDIIKLFESKGIIEKVDSISKDLEDFVSSKIGKQLFSISKEDQHLLFFVNLCGSAHVLIIEKKSNSKECWWKIFQSWQNEFTLAQWLDLEESNNIKFKNDFKKYGKNQKLNHEQIASFIKGSIKDFQPRMQYFMELGIGVPYELDAIMYKVKID